MYKEICHTELSSILLNQLSQGAFLTVKLRGVTNIMTISCGSLGFTWKKPTFTVMVRHSRYTHEIIEKSENFTLSFPLNGQLKNELTLCGTLSGRNSNKIEECRLMVKEGSLADTMILEECDLFLECKIIYKHSVIKSNLDEEIVKTVYLNEDYHTLYFSEIVKIYTKE